jgi:hypothetical protein
MMDQEERELFAKGIQAATAASSGADLDAALAGLGWQDALASDPATTVATVFEHQGAAATTSSALGVVLASALGVALDGSTGVVLPAMGQVAAPGSGGVVRGVALAPLTGQARALVATDESVVVVDTADLDLRAIEGIDPRLGLLEVTGAAQPIEPVSTTSAWSEAVAAGQRALAHELVGVSRTMLTLAREHAVDRVQFDRPIAGFQAVRHRLADSLVAIEAAHAAAQAASDDGTSLTAALAKAVAGRGARTVARHAQQVLAGIGFTTEHSLHLYVRRALVLDHLLGDARSLTASLGVDLLRDRRLPSLLPL